MIKGGPKIIEDGLVLNLDASDKKSFSGIDVVNRSPGVNFTFSNSNSSTFKVKQNESVIDIPQIGKRTVKYYYTYNDYIGGSGQCCPAFLNYGQATGLSGSTLYTYTIIYKTESGYTNANFMYRYEYNASSTYLTEAGVFNNSNRVHLGDGWYKAWGTFTTQSTTSYANLYLFYYQYATYDIIYVADVSLHEGSYIPHHRHFPTSSSNGGWKDTSGNDYDGTLTNGVSWSNDNQGSLDFDGSNDYVTLGQSLNNVGSTASIEVWFKSEESIGSSQYAIMFGWGDGTSYYSNFSIGNWFGAWGDESIHLGINSASVILAERNGHSKYHDGNWHHAVATIGVNNYAIYVDGSAVTTSFLYGTQSSSFTNIFNFSASTYSTIGSRPYTITAGGGGFFNGKIPLVRVYDKILTAAEVLSNYNETKNRF